MKSKVITWTIIVIALLGRVFSKVFSKRFILSR